MNSPLLVGQLFDAARLGDADKLTALLDEHPEQLHVRAGPHEWTLLHAAAFNGQLAVVDILLNRGLDVNSREKGDNTYAMHWAAAAGHVDVVRRLIDAGGDVVGSGDDHELEVIGWATCWDGCDDDKHRAIVDLLRARGARHHIFSAIAMGLGDEVRRIVASDPAMLTKTMSRNENFQRPIHFAVRMNRPDMVALLLELGADPAAADGSGIAAMTYAASPNVDRRIIELLVGGRPADLFSALALGDEAMADRLLRDDPASIDRGALHMLTKRGDLRAVEWLLEHGANPNALWPHWDADVTPLHLAARQNHREIALVLLRAGADPTIRDSKHGSDALGWAEFFKRRQILALLRENVARRSQPPK